MSDFEPTEDMAPDAGEYWDDYTLIKPTEQHCEACNVWLGYNYPAVYCNDCKPRQLVEVQSSNLEAVGWEPVDTPPDTEGQRFGVLTVKFKSGALYKYQGVSETAFEQFLDADSPGSYFHTHIKTFFEGIKEETP